MTARNILGAAGVLGVLAAPLAAADMPVTDNAFCERVQRDLTGSALPVNNIVYADYEGFKQSKLKVDPIELAQYVLTDGDDQTPLRVSCKTKTSDHLQDRYGADAATGDKTCADINRGTIAAVFAALTDEEKAALKIQQADIVIEPDTTTYMGSSFVTDYDYVYRGPEAKMHVLAKSLYVTWTNPMFIWAPEKFRGVRYCHLIAPEYAKRLVLGEAPLPLPTKK